jgi:hypothetical protein
MKYSYARHFRFGDDRGKEGNGRKKRMARQRRIKPTTYTRHRKKGYKNHLLSSLLLEDIGEELYAINLNKRPLNGAIFNAEVVKHMKKAGTKVDNQHIEDLKTEFNNLQHSSQKINEINALLKEDEGNEELINQKETYEKAFDNTQKKLYRLNKITNNYTHLDREYTLFKTKMVKVRVIATSKSSHTGYDCICEPV